MDIKKFIKIIEDAGITVRSYSGRGMFGDYCVGVITSNPTNSILDIVETAWDEWGLEEEFRDLLYMLKDPQTDNMGHDTIIYWPKLTWPERKQ